jgi:phosphopantothenoylcysteine decarboxylase/phosphopantothenate--cysteine ligase
VTRETNLSGKNILLGVTGSVAAYKAIELTRRLKAEGASVNVVMTRASMNFVTPLSLEVASGNKVSTDLFSEPMAHIRLPSDSGAMVVAPATANIIGKFANGIADDLLSTCFLSMKGSVIVAPAMNWRMYENPVVKKNLLCLAEAGVVESPPEYGSLACGEEGTGRMADTEKIVEAVKSAFAEKDLKDERIVITAGPTREYIDPVRFISNRSTGKMGYALARIALRRGAEVTLVSGPSQLTAPSGAKLISVDTAEEMRDAVIRELPSATAVIMAAAVSDFSPETKTQRKLDKSSLTSIRLKSTPDILAECGSMRQRPLLVGFAAETGRNIERARKKLTSKRADMIVLNDVSSPDSGFDVDTNKVVIIDKDGASEYPLLKKDEVAWIILDRVSAMRGDGSA